MSVTPTYPGVYVLERPSGNRTITGVATSITAFVGTAPRGPANEPVPIAGFGDFERTFGGLWRDSGLGYAIRDFFLNGGGDALVVRVVHTEPPGDAADTEEPEGVSAATAKLRLDKPPTGDTDDDTGDTGLLILEATGPGAWANILQAEVVHPVPDEVEDSGQTSAGVKIDPDIQDVADAQGVDPSDLFNLVVSEGATLDSEGKPTGVLTETYLNVTVRDGPRRVDLVLAASAMARVSGKLPEKRPDEDIYPVAAGDEGNDGSRLESSDYLGSEDDKTGFHALVTADLFNLLCIPPPTLDTDVPPDVWAEAAAFCANHRAFLIVDPPALQTLGGIQGWVTGEAALTGSNMRNAALYFPRIRRPDPLRGGATVDFAACGAVAGTYARTDGGRGVWKAPAGTDAGLAGVVGLTLSLTDAENGQLNPAGINCLRTFRGIGSVVWGARTLRGPDPLADEYKYVPVRRLALFLEETLYRNTQWVVFEPNDEPLWAQIRLSIGTFMQSLFRKGAFQGTTPREAYFVRCDSDTTTQYDRDLGIVNILVGFAPLKPAEFVMISIQQKTASATA